MDWYFFQPSELIDYIYELFAFRSMIKTGPGNQEKPGMYEAGNGFFFLFSYIIGGKTGI